MIRISNCLSCNHIGPADTFAHAEKVGRMQCPRCNSTGPFTTNWMTHVQAEQSVARATAPAETPKEEPTMAVEAPTKPKREKAAKPEQQVLIDTTDPRHKELLKLVKAYRKIKNERAEVLGDLKERMDNAAEKVVGEMKALGLKEFVLSDVEVSLDDGAPVLTVKTRKADTEEDGDED